jgi:hypothetical protein
MKTLKRKKKKGWLSFVMLRSVKLNLNSNYIAMLIVTGNVQQHWAQVLIKKISI